MLAGQLTEINAFLSFFVLHSPERFYIFEIRKSSFKNLYESSTFLFHRKKQQHMGLKQRKGE